VLAISTHGLFAQDVNGEWQNGQGYLTDGFIASM
jgi:hypothetical protein